MKACLAKDETIAGISNCNDTAYTAATKVLTSVYRTNVEKLKRTGANDDAARDAESLKRLIASERAWIDYRDSDCQLEGITMLGGSGEGTIVGGCLYARTADLAKRLDDLFKMQ